MARPKKQAVVSSEVGPMTIERLEEVAPAAEPQKTIEDAVDALRKALGALISVDPKAAEKAMSEILGVQAQTMRTVDDRPKKIEIPKGSFDPLPPPPPPEPKPGVVYYCEAAGHRQVISPSQKKFYGDGNVDIIPPVVKEAENHIIRIEDPAEVKLMDAKLEKQARRGGRPLVVKLRDEIAEQVQEVRGAIPNKNPEVNVHTPLSDLVTA